ncbi:GDSL-like lipase/acylhydrolase [Ceratobasidium theobromae]|uniref:GDSL-like lipase/acylhydrolase n=1 Tax=Ceratobasidium theobromae TaxID=1582974 RepID=A0A5N5QF34_9AGAM|nr:GDSL-like lipase/acylhydrolase [Ceratobasidium theobromae]
MRGFGVAVFIGLAASVMAAPGILLIGDSTVTAEKGWGPGFCADTSGLAQCTNLASSGKTTVTWQAQTQYSTMLTKCKTADTYALIQFGHNDQKVMTTTQFAANLTSLTNIIKNAGCSPVLVTSLARRTFSSEHATSDSLGPYSAETINVANNLGLPLLPLLADSRAYLDKLGKTNAAQFDYADGDTTHLNALGAKYFGRIVADEVKAKVSALSSYIVVDAALSAKIAAGTL